MIKSGSKFVARTSMVIAFSVAAPSALAQQRATTETRSASNGLKLDFASPMGTTNAGADEAIVPLRANSLDALPGPSDRSDTSRDQLELSFGALQDGGEPSTGWKVTGGTYLSLSGIDGEASIAGIAADVDLSFTDILDNFDVFGVSGRVEAWKDDHWGIIFDGMYMSIEGDFTINRVRTVTIELERELTGPLGLRTIDLRREIEFDIRFGTDIDVEIKQAQLDLALGARIYDESISSDGEPWPRLTFDAIGGARYQYLKQEITLRGTVTTPRRSEAFGPIVLGGSNDWIEPMIGGRVALQLNEQWTIIVRGDTSGFGLGSASDLTWNLVTGIDYRLSDTMSLKAGYKWQGLDYSTGSGPSQFGADWIVEGLSLALTFQF